MRVDHLRKAERINSFIRVDGWEETIYIGRRIEAISEEVGNGIIWYAGPGNGGPATHASWVDFQVWQRSLKIDYFVSSEICELSENLFEREHQHLPFEINKVYHHAISIFDGYSLPVGPKSVCGRMVLVVELSKIFERSSHLLE